MIPEASSSRSARASSEDEVQLPLLSSQAKDTDDKSDHRTPSCSLDRLERPRSFSDDAELDGHTLYEKKCILINREIDAFGMGRYQWCIWGL